ncbi:Ribose import ATP-binding protein RbsA [Pelotomaculum sp. FP]|uniref:sugar ABC transporter ATP-binding protein n=1 Tax=Pelotomaculum sp. FP TaxID=261474 RepID=UPI0010FFF396|nr:sugar ABC transporter ATP-binding protein [Pelotomaculum sp. FP]TEB11887.1 Ribose import ATP-binding protein RbsA [Pelotomaculum sp. FP]
MPVSALNAAGETGTVLRLSQISKIYPGTVALHNVNLDVQKGEVHGIIGKNGAGKSTLVGIIAGMISPTEGEIFVENKRFTALTRIISKKEKISIVPQDPQVILDFTVAENLFMGDYICRNRFVNWKEIYSRAEQILKKAGLHINARAKAADLSISERQLLLVLKAFYVENAGIVILDEVSASLSQKDEQILYKIIDQIKATGNTVLFISHRTDELLKVCDRVTVLRDGRTIVTESCADLNREKLSSLIVGEEFRANKRTQGSVPTCDMNEGPVLSVENLTRLGFYHNITFQLRKGEILGLAGLRGSGRTEILKGIAGIEPAEGGLIRVGGTVRRLTHPSQALKEGIVYLPEDRENEGILGTLSVRENLILNSLPAVSRGGVVNKARERQFTAGVIETLGIKTASQEQEVNQLSGGNKQKVVVGRIAATLPKVVLLDEPTKGVDISAKESILDIVRENLCKTAGIIMTSPGLDDLIMVCDRILILYRGEITGELKREDFSEGDLYMAVQGNKIENPS